MDGKRESMACGPYYFLRFLLRDYMWVMFFSFFKKNKDRMPRVRHRLMLNKTTIKIANRTER